MAARPSRKYRPFPGRREQIEAAGRTVHWWRRAYPGHTRAGYPPVVTGAGPTALASQQEAVADLSAECWRGSWWPVPSHHKAVGTYFWAKLPSL
jgi:hypothetical protein